MGHRPSGPFELTADGDALNKSCIGNFSLKPGLSATFSSLNHPNYRLWFTGQLISLIGTWMQNVAIPWLVYHLTGSPFFLGLVSFTSAVPMLTLTLWAGVLADRMHRKRLLIITQTVMMLLAFLLAAAFYSQKLEWWHMLFFSISGGIAQAFDAPARQAIVADLVPREQMMNAIALNSAMFNGARVIGPALAGITLAATGPGWCFIINGFSFLAVILGLAMMKLPRVHPHKIRARALSEIREGLSYIWRHESIRILILMLAVTNVFAIGYTSLLPAFAKDVLASPEVGLGLMSTAIGIGALLGALLLAALGNFQHKGMLLIAGNLLFPAFVIAFSYSHTMWISLVLLTGTGFGFMVQNATVNTLIQSRVEDRLRGRVMSVYTVVFQGFFPIGALFAGTVAQHLNIQSGAALGATMALSFGLILLWRVPKIRRLA